MVPLVRVGAVQVNANDVELPAMAATVGVPGAVGAPATRKAEEVEADPVPTAFTVATVKL